MFKGVIKQNSRRILMDLLRERDRDTFFIGCSGAFTIENLIVRNLKPKRITSSDVSIFTNALGFFLSDQDYDLEIAGEQFQFLRPYLDKGLIYKTAVILYLQDLAESIVGTNLHNKRMVTNYLHLHDQMIEGKARRLNENKRIFEESGVTFEYYAEDVVDYVRRVEEGSVFCSFPPFWVGGYEKLYKFIDEVVLSVKLRPDYKMFDDKSLQGMVETLKNTGGDFIIGTNRYELFKDDPDLRTVGYDYFSEEELVHFVTNFTSKTKFGMINPDFISLNYGVKLGSGEDFKNLTLKDKVKIVEIPLDLFDAIRLSRISKKIKKVATPTTKFGVFIN